MNHEQKSSPRVIVGACAVAAIVATALLLGGIDVLAEHYAAQADAVFGQALPAAKPSA